MKETISDRWCTTTVTLINCYFIMINDVTNVCKVLALLYAHYVSIFINSWRKIMSCKPSGRMKDMVHMNEIININDETLLVNFEKWFLFSVNTHLINMWNKEPLHKIGPIYA